MESFSHFGRSWLARGPRQIKVLEGGTAWHEGPKDESRQADILERAFTEQPVDIRDYLAVVRVRKLTIVIVATLVVAVVLALSYRQTPLYRADARLLIKPISSDAFYVPIPNLETEAEFLASEPIAAAAREEMGTDHTPRDLLGGLDVQPIAETEVVIVSYTSKSPEFAQNAANAFATAYIDYKREQALQELRAAQATVQNRIDSAQDKLVQTEEELRRARRDGDAILIQSLDAERGSLIASIAVLQQRLQDLQPERSVQSGGGQVIEGASLPGSPASPNHVRTAFFGAFFGLLLGIGTAFLKDKLDDRFRSRKDLERSMGAPVLATVPRFNRAKMESSSLAVIEDPRSRASEAYRSLRTNVQFLAAQHGIRSLLITSPSPGEGKTVTCANLAVALAQAGKRVVIVSSDLRRPTIEQHFRVANDTGLSLWLIGGEPDPWDYLKRPPIPNLRVLPSGPVPPNPAELLASERFRFLASLLEENADIVLYDSPPTLGLADSVNIAARAAGTILIVDANETGRSQATHAREELERVGTRIVGTVLNSFDASGKAAYYYASYYQSGYTEPTPQNQSPVPPSGEQAVTREKRASPFSFRR